MKNRLAFVFACIGWFAVIAQYYLMVGNRVTSVFEASVRFFSFFTILTNSLVAIYFTYQSLNRKPELLKVLNKPGSLTAITVYITIVGLVYQVVLRSVWEPTGLQKLVDELLHSVIPVMVIIFWFFYENKAKTSWTLLPAWLIYPFIYLIFILIRGGFSDFYPYPFVNVNKLGFGQVLINSVVLLVLFVAFSALFVGLGKLMERKR